MKTRFLLTFVLAWCLFLPSANLFAEGEKVLVVSDRNEIQLYDWHQGLNLDEVTKSQDLYELHVFIYIISNERMTVISELHKKKLDKVLLTADDIVIFGSLTTPREAKLRQDPRIDKAFQKLPPRKYFE